MRTRNLKLLLVTTILIASVTCVSCPRLGAGSSTGAITVDGVRRTYLIHVPATLQKKLASPLLIALHQFTDTGRGMQRMTGFDAVADREGFIVVYPDARQRVWNANPDQPSSIIGKPADDVGFIRALIDTLSGQYPIDRDRVYVVGASSGGLMAHRIAGELTDKVAAAASVMITLPKTWPDAVTPLRPLPFLMIQGKADPFFPWEGGTVNEGPSRSTEYLSAQDSVAYWVENNLAEENATREELPDTDPDDGTSVFRETHAALTGGQPVVLYGIRGGGHTWPGNSHTLPEFLVGKTSNDISASEVVWDFLKEYRRAE